MESEAVAWTLYFCISWGLVIVSNNDGVGSICDMCMEAACGHRHNSGLSSASMKNPHCQQRSEMIKVDQCDRKLHTNN